VALLNLLLVHIHPPGIHQMPLSLSSPVSVSGVVSLVYVSVTNI
jgi:hypothetical protein